jgi:predicted  nucleic acid-binding Zn-ribbon protein
MSPPDSPPGFLDRLRRFDPTVLPIVVAALVLVGAVIWLLGRPLPAPQATGPDAQTAQQLAELRAGLTRVEALNARIAAVEGTAQRLAALENRPAPTAPDLAPLRAEATAAASRAEAAEQRAAAAARQVAALQEQVATLTRDLAARPNVDPAAIAQLGARLDQLAARPAVDPASVAQRSAVEQLATRLDQLTARADALARDLQASGAQAQQRHATTEQALSGVAGRLAASEGALATRAQAIETQGNRIGALETALTGRLTALDGQLSQRAQAAEQLASRLTALESQQQRLTALETRAARLAALDTARAALDAGRPLGQIPNAPEALSRFATAAPPTEAGLRLSFDAAARAALAASEPPAGAGVLDSAVSRLSGLVTVRRGEEVLWGDAAAAEIERARRALEAGDLDATMRHLAKLSAPARAAMGDWIARAEALLAARAALRQMAAG